MLPWRLNTCISRNLWLTFIHTHLTLLESLWIRFPSMNTICSSPYHLKGLPFPLANEIFNPIFIHFSSQKWIDQQTCIERLLIQKSPLRRPALRLVRAFLALWCCLDWPWLLFHGYDSSPLVSPLWIASSLFDFVENIVFLKLLNKHLRWPCIVCTKVRSAHSSINQDSEFGKNFTKKFSICKTMDSLFKPASQNVVEPKYHFRENILWSLTE